MPTALDHERGGEISQRLALLYDYMQRRLLEANMQQSDAPLADVLGLLSTLSEAWAEIRTTEPTPQVAKPAHKPISQETEKPSAESPWAQPALPEAELPPVASPWTQPEPAYSSQGYASQVYASQAWSL